MRAIDLIIVHCSATEAGRDFRISDIDRWHRERGFKSVGYHYVVTIGGEIEAGRSEAAIGAHCKGFNGRSIGVCYIGGLRDGNAADTRNAAQKTALTGLIRQLLSRYPAARVVGHRDLNPGKACPCFDAAAEYSPLT